MVKQQTLPCFYIRCTYISCWTGGVRGCGRVEPRAFGARASTGGSRAGSGSGPGWFGYFENFDFSGLL